ncbi:hypothetical protein [Nocardia sp. NPDC004722]
MQPKSITRHALYAFAFALALGAASSVWLGSPGPAVAASCDTAMAPELTDSGAYSWCGRHVHWTPDGSGRLTVMNLWADSDSGGGMVRIKFHDRPQYDDSYPVAAGGNISRSLPAAVLEFTLCDRANATCAAWSRP